MSQTLNNLKKLIIEMVEEEVSTNEYASTQAKKRKKRGLAPLESLEEKLNLFLEKNKPTNPSKWSYYKSQAKKKFDVYPSAYANAWAAKQYKAAGGGWKKEQIGEASMTGNLDGGEGPPKTPYAFQSKKKRAQDKKKEDDISTNSTGFTKVNEAVDEGDFIKAMQEIQAGLDEAEYGFNDLGRLKGMSSSDKRIVKTLSSKFKVLMKDVEKARRVITTESINEATKQEGKKRFRQRHGIGRAKYTVSSHDGKSKHKDGSDFFDINIFKNKKDLNNYMNDLLRKGYVEESINEVTKQEVNALRNLVKGIGNLKKDFSKATYIGDKELRKKDYNKHYETLLDAEKAMVELMQFFKTKEMLGEGRYHDWRNDESLTPKQKIGRSMREIRDALNELDKTVKMNLKLKTELKMKSEDYWKNTHKALTKISERLVKMANKVGNLK